jgi:hypothetical protein
MAYCEQHEASTRTYHDNVVWVFQTSSTDGSEPRGVYMPRKAYAVWRIKQQPFFGPVRALGRKEGE